MQQKLLGIEHTKPNKIHLQTPSIEVCLATTAGSSKTVKQKMDGNEDAGAIWRDHDHMMFALADAHFGASSAIKACEKLPGFLKLFSGQSAAVKQFGAHIKLDQVLNQEETQSATTLITAQISKNQMLWTSSGDSKAFLFRDDLNLQLNETNPAMFLGPPLAKMDHAMEELEIPNSDPLARKIGLLLTLSHLSHHIRNHKGTEAQLNDMIEVVQKHAPGGHFTREDLLKPWHPAHLICLRNLPTWGTKRLKKGDRLLFATDGIDENVSGLSRRDIQTIMTSSESIENITRRLLKHALKRGGDNCTVIIYEHR